MFKINGMDIPYEIVINKKLKYIRIGLSDSGIKVSVPYRINSAEVERLLRGKGQWIAGHYDRLRRARDNKSWGIEKGKVLYCGEIYSLNIHDGNRNCAVFENGALNIYVSANRASGMDMAAVEETLRRWYINKAREAINDRLSYYSGIMGLSYNDVRIKDQKTRWGSCSKKGNLNFNWRLIMAPPWILDYVVAHELCHLAHMNHSKEFWSMVSIYAPRYKDARKWLKENGAVLNL
jgi:Predicted metal-dependent hydrolase